MTEFALLMKKLRKERGLSLNALAKKLKTHKGYISGWENGKVNPPSAKMIHRIAVEFSLNEIDLQILAWAAKAPVICRKEMLKRCMM